MPSHNNILRYLILLPFVFQFRQLVVGLGTALVLFLFYFFPFRCMLKDRKLQPGQMPSRLNRTVFVLCLLSHGFESYACYYFLRL